MLKSSAFFLAALTCYGLIQQGEARRRQKRTYNVDGTYTRYTSMQRNIPYCLDTVYTTNEQTAFQTALTNLYSQIIGGQSCINFTPAAGATGTPAMCPSTAATSYRVKFTPLVGAAGSSKQPYSFAYPGYYSKLTEQPTSIVQPGDTYNTACSTTPRCIMKYLSILLSLRNEHQRPDRPLNVVAANLQVPSAYNVTAYGSVANWNLVTPAGYYDYCSITHNQPTDFAVAGTQAFTVTSGFNGGVIPNIGPKLSYMDCVTINMQYGCASSLAVAQATCAKDMCYNYYTTNGVIATTPGATTTAAGVTTAPPVTTTPGPGTTTVAGVTTSIPPGTTTTPSGTTTTPAGTTTTPSGTTTTPSGTTTTAAVTTTTPAVTTTTPAVTTTTPAVTTTTPAVTTTTPAVTTTTPAVTTTTPAVTTTTPAVTTTTPAATTTTVAPTTTTAAPTTTTNPCPSFCGGPITFDEVATIWDGRHFVFKGMCAQEVDNLNAVLGSPITITSLLGPTIPSVTGGTVWSDLGNTVTYVVVGTTKYACGASGCLALGTVTPPINKQFEFIDANGAQYTYSMDTATPPKFKKTTGAANAQSSVQCAVPPATPAACTASLITGAWSAAYVIKTTVSRTSYAVNVIGPSSTPSGFAVQTMTQGTPGSDTTWSFNPNLDDDLQDAMCVSIG